VTILRGDGRVGYRFSLVLSREITAEESAALQDAGCAGAVFSTDSLPTDAGVAVTKMDFDDAVSPSLAEAIESALEAVKIVPGLSVPGLNVPAQKAEAQASAEEPAQAAIEQPAKKPAAKKASAKKASAKKPAAEEAEAAEPATIGAGRP
jgi:hypothetical protein